MKSRGVRLASPLHPMCSSKAEFIALNSEIGKRSELGVFVRQCCLCWELFNVIFDRISLL